MSGALDSYVEQSRFWREECAFHFISGTRNSHSFAGLPVTAIAEAQNIEIHGIPTSCFRDNTSSQEWERLLIEYDAIKRGRSSRRPGFFRSKQGAIAITVHSGNDYILHYASLIRHALKGEVEKVEVVRYPEMERQVCVWTGLEPIFQKGDIVVCEFERRLCLGDVKRVRHLSETHSTSPHRWICRRDAETLEANERARNREQSGHKVLPLGESARRGAHRQLLRVQRWGLPLLWVKVVASFEISLSALATPQNMAGETSRVERSSLPPNEASTKSFTSRKERPVRRHQRSISRSTAPRPFMYASTTRSCGRAKG